VSCGTFTVASSVTSLSGASPSSNSSRVYVPSPRATPSSGMMSEVSAPRSSGLNVSQPDHTTRGFCPSRSKRTVALREK